MKKNNIIKGIFFAGTLFLGVSCTHLNEEILDGVVVSEDGGGGTVNPVAFLVVPRFVAAVAIFPIINWLASLIGIASCYVTASMVKEVEM